MNYVEALVKRRRRPPIDHAKALDDLAEQVEYAADYCEHVGLFSTSIRLRQAQGEMEEHAELLRSVP